MFALVITGNPLMRVAPGVYLFPTHSEAVTCAAKLIRRGHAPDVWPSDDSECLDVFQAYMKMGDMLDVLPVLETGEQS